MKTLYESISDSFLMTSESILDIDKHTDTQSMKRLEKERKAIDKLIEGIKNLHLEKFIKDSKVLRFDIINRNDSNPDLIWFKFNIDQDLLEDPNISTKLGDSGDIRDENIHNEILRLISQSSSFRLLYKDYVFNDSFTYTFGLPDNELLEIVINRVVYNQPKFVDEITIKFIRNAHSISTSEEEALDNTNILLMKYIDQKMQKEFKIK